MKVLLINGSPRKCCTFTALQEVAAGLEENGVEAEIVSIGTKPVYGCRGCGLCKKNGNNRCVIDDDIVNSIIEKAAQADGLVVGTPVYYSGINGALKAVMDRLFYAGQNLLAYKPAAGVASTRRAGSTVTIDQINKFFLMNNMPLVSSCYWPMVHGQTVDQVKQDAEGLYVMHNLGRNMAWILKCIEAGKANGTPVPECPPRPMTNFIDPNGQR